MLLTTLSTHRPPHAVAALPVVWRPAAIKMGVMIDQLLEQLRTSVTTSSTLPEQTRADLLAHLQSMEEELRAHPEAPAESSPPAESHGLARLRASVEELEASHPDITSLVSRLATHLSNLGI
jgi:hypothetical protein